MVWSKNTAKQWINVAIIFFFMFIFKYICPPFGPVTEVGVGVLGVFLGIIWGWSTCGVVWTSILGILAIGFTGFQSVTEAMQFGFGHNNVLTLLFVFPFMYAIEQAGIVKTIAYFIVNLKIARGRPWIVSFLLILAASLISALVNPFVAIFFVWSLFYMVCTIYEIEKGKYTKFMIAGIAFGATMGCMLFTFAPPVMQPMGAYTQISGVSINAAAYSLFAITMQVSYYLAYILLGKFVLRIDLSNVKISTIEGMEKVDGYQKVMFVFLVAFLVILFWPSIFPASWTITAVFNALSTKATPALLIVLMSVLNFTKGINPVEMFEKGINWSAILLTAAVMVIINAVASPDTGISALLTQLLTPVMTGKSTIVFLLIVTLLPTVLTSVGSNVVVGVIFIPIAYNFAAAAGLNHIAIAMMLILCTTCALATPAGCATAAILHGNKDWIDSVDATKYGVLLILIVWLLTLIIGYPLGCILFPL
jgi:sodium-dependent dicarboxylate transporter 2/3/5